MTAPLLVLVPGLGLGPEAWRPTARRLPTSLTLTLPAYGEPATRTRDLSPDALAHELLQRLADRAHVPPPGQVVLAGHSASCQVVVAAALLAPTRVRGLVLVGPTTDPRAATWPRLVLRWVRTAVHERPGQLPSLVQQYSRTGLGPMRRGMDAARHHRVDHALAGTTCPILVLRGPADRICPQDWAERVGSGPARTSATLEAGAHMVPTTHGDLVAPHVADFLHTCT